jgi:hypothetical protein
MICVPLDDVEDVLQRKLEIVRNTDVRAFLLGIIDELTALQVDTEARMCPECGDPPYVQGGLAMATHCIDCWKKIAELTHDERKAAGLT